MIVEKYDESKHQNLLIMPLSEMANLTGQDCNRDFVFDITREFIKTHYDTVATQKKYDVGADDAYLYIHEDIDMETGIVTIFEYR